MGKPELPKRTKRAPQTEVNGIRAPISIGAAVRPPTPLKFVQIFQNPFAVGGYGGVVSVWTGSGSDELMKQNMIQF